MLQKHAATRINNEREYPYIISYYFGDDFNCNFELQSQKGKHGDETCGAISGNSKTS